MRGAAERRTWALQLLDGDKGGGIVGEVAVGEGAAARHRGSWAALPVLAVCDVQRIEPGTTAILCIFPLYQWTMTQHAIRTDTHGRQLPSFCSLQHSLCKACSRMSTSL